MVGFRLYLSALILITFSINASQVSGGNVLWDISHTPLENFHPAGDYQQLTQLLSQNDYTVTAGENPVNVDGLWNTDILVISVLSNFESVYTDAEVNRIVNFIAGGGGLIVLADNSMTRPQNIAPVLEQFGLRASRGDDLRNPVQYEDHPLFEGVGRLVFDVGGAVEVDEQQGGVVIARDENELGAVAINQQHGGAVILIGDADIWTNRIIFLMGNDRFALNCFAFADRTREGRIEVDMTPHDVYLPQSLTLNRQINTANTGEGFLEVGFTTDEEVPWISLNPVFALIDAHEEIDLTVLLDTEQLQVDTTVSARIIVNHNDPTNDPVEVEVTMHVLPNEPVHFDVPGPTGLDHSLLVREMTIDGEIAQPGIEVAVFTPNGICAGGSVFMGGMLGIAARADDPFTEIIEGFLNDEPFMFRVYVPWDDVEMGAATDYERGPNSFQGDGFTILTLDSRPNAEQQLILNARWNIISINVIPFDLNFESVFAPLIERNMLIMVKDGAGRFWDLRFGFSNLIEWNLTRGYQIMVAQPTTLDLNGMIVPADLPIMLSFGWSIIPYLPREPIDVETAVATINENINILKRDDGAFYYPRWNWDGIGALEPGEGYQVRLVAVDTLIYPEEADNVAQSAPFAATFMPSPGGMDMSLLLVDFPPQASLRLLSDNNVQVGGSTVGADGRTGLAVWGDDPATAEIEGLSEGERFWVCLVEGDRLVSLDIDWLTGEALYTTDAISVGRLNRTVRPPDRIGLSCYPNPFNNQLSVNIAGLQHENITVTIHDLTGRILDVRHCTSNKDGSSQIVSFNAENWSAGVILVKISSTKTSHVIKTVHLP